MESWYTAQECLRGSKIDGLFLAAVCPS
jgi:hypothetical protein